MTAVYPQYTFPTCVCSPLIASGIDSTTTFFRTLLFWSFIQNNQWKNSIWTWSALLPCLRKIKTSATVRGFLQVRSLHCFLLHFVNPGFSVCSSHSKTCCSPLSNIRSFFSPSTVWPFRCLQPSPLRAPINTRAQQWFLLWVLPWVM